MAETPLLDVKHLKKHFPIKGGVFSKTIGYVYAVDDINFTLEKGETLGLVGYVCHSPGWLGHNVVPVCRLHGDLRFPLPHPGSRGPRHDADG